MNWLAAKAVRYTILLALLSVFSIPLKAQVADASLSGTITGTSGKPLASARVSVKNLATGQSTTADTSATGTYYLAGLAPGDYALAVTALGLTSRRGRSRWPPEARRRSTQP